jgi:CBS domain-containing protein
MTTVGEIMNRKLLYVIEGEEGNARALLLRFGVSALPVLDDELRPVGLISLRDFDADGKPTGRGDPLTVAENDSLEDAARVLASTDHHLIVVVNDAGLAVGIASVVDFLRALQGMPARHPRRFEIECTHSEDP